MAFSFQLTSHFAYAIYAKVVIPHALDLKLQIIISLRAS